ncbi:Multiprotein bridging factor 1 [Musa troglodytarum]|uniref:Multiprotein bridging factor 1 n=1 Tax=Musa troglodytarum TaxID=320322 RepID=A0A9E7I1H6_9LILI|nr:Multiprotein bridging factor 1 [Musa troglodytarum]
MYARKLDETTEPAALERVGAGVRHAIQRARLAKLINERAQVVGDYEGSRAVPDQAVLAKLEKVLDVKLRGKLKRGIGDCECLVK